MKLLFTSLAALALCGPALLRAQAPAPASAASAAAPLYRAEVVNAINAAVELHRGNKSAEALSRIEKTLADLPNLTPTETGLLQRTQGQLALQLNQPAVAVKSFETALATNALSKPDLLVAAESLTRAHFILKNYAASLEWAQKAAAQGSTWSGLPGLVTRAHYLSNNFAAVVKDLEPRAQGAPGTQPASEEELRILAAAYDKVGNSAAYTKVIERLLREHPRAEYWPDLLARAQRQPGWQQRYDIDLFRLRLQLDAMDDPSDYVVLALDASKAGLPAEAQAVMETGYAKGMLGKGSGAAEQQKLRALVTKQASDDRASLQLAAGRAPAVSDARSAGNALTTGSALVSIGQNERGLEYMKAALGGPLPDPAQARLQYAVALHRSGKTAEAIEQLKAVSDHATIGLMARLWSLALAPPKKT